MQGANLDRAAQGASPVLFWIHSQLLNLEVQIPIMHRHNTTQTRMWELQTPTPPTSSTLRLLLWRWRIGKLLMQGRDQFPLCCRGWGKGELRRTSISLMMHNPGPVAQEIVPNSITLIHCARLILVAHGLMQPAIRLISVRIRPEILPLWIGTMWCQLLLDERRAQSALWILKKATTFDCCHVKASTVFTSNVWIPGCWSCPVHVRSVDMVRLTIIYIKKERPE
jgi:hypothetical protein